MRRLLIILGCLLILSGCDNVNLQNSKKQNLELQAKCAHDTAEWFSHEWMPEPKGTVRLDYSNHYNGTQNKCYAMVEYHFHTGDAGSSGWGNEISLWNVYEHR